jgi:RNA polymerase sigma-70 factor (sigma-E family)
MGAVSEAEFAEVYLGRARAMRRTAYLLCGDWHRAEDLVQSAFARLYAAWPSIRDSGAVDAYLRKTLVRIYIDESRRAWHRERPSETIPDSAAAAGGDIEDAILLRHALAAVPRRQRACLVLRFFDDCSVEATADALGCSVGTVKSNTARGLVALRAQLPPELLPDTGNPTPEPARSLL